MLYSYISMQQYIYIYILPKEISWPIVSKDSDIFASTIIYKMNNIKV